MAESYTVKLTRMLEDDNGNWVDTVKTIELVEECEVCGVMILNMKTHKDWHRIASSPVWVR